MSMQSAQASQRVGQPDTSKSASYKKPGGKIPRQHSFEKKELPQNWDEIVSNYVSGAITQRDIARETGWCVQTVRKYLKETIQA